jgi:hypothetical protein
MRLKSWPQTIAGTFDWLRSNVLSSGPVGLAIAWMNLAYLLAAAALLATIKYMDGVVAADKFAPGLPLTVKAEPGDRLVFASMFVQSNDKFFATDSAGIDLFEGLYPVAGDLTSKVVLWDAGTEKDEAPGTGPNQAPRQAGPNTSPDEHGVIRVADDGFAYPAVSDLVQLTVRPQGVKSKSGS